MPIASNELRNILTFDDLIQYLEEKLDWPLHEYGFNELTFEYLPEELGLKDIEAAQIGRIHQLRPLQYNQPWGIFFIEFEKKKLPIVVLRRILSHLVLKKRASASKSREAAWDTDDLLFITAFGEVENQQREIAFAHFHQSPPDLPTLRVLGWDGADTPLKLAHVDAILRERFCWPDNPTDHENWREQWRKPFRHRIGHVINTANTLAEVLAALARGIRDRALRMMSAESERGPLRKLHKAFQKALIHDLTEESFADTYAQTITYGLLTAAISRTKEHKGLRGSFIVSDNLTDMVPITNPFLREMLQTFLSVGGRKGGINFDELGIQDVVDLLRGDETDLLAILRDFGNRTRGEDPVIHFYEHFLSSYDKKLKIKRGAFYTPQPVVFYIVRSVHELLQTEFGLEDGLADTTTWGEMEKRNPAINIPEGVSPEEPFVLILDIATGTGTFLVEVIDVIHRTMTAKWKREGHLELEFDQLWNEYVPKHLLPRLYGYELMMAPYAIAHMKIGLKLHETGYRFGSDERVHVYLTNSLEPPSKFAEQAAADLFEALGHEAQAVNEVKRKKRFTVVIGNPPYSINSCNLQESAVSLIERFRYVDGQRILERGALKFETILQDDYIKFWGLCLQILQGTSIGVVSMISNNGFLTNRVLRGVRKAFIDNFTRLTFLNLHGNRSKNEVCPNGSPDDNVFDINQGVGISILSKTPDRSSVSKVDLSDLWGSRDFKYRTLGKIAASQTSFQEHIPKQPYFAFALVDGDIEDEYRNFVALDEAIPFNKAGFVSGRDDFAVDFEVEPLEARISDFLNPKNSDNTIRERYSIRDAGGYVLAKRRQQALAAELKASNIIRRVQHRPFDYRFVAYSEAILTSPQKAAMNQLIAGNNIALCLSRGAEITRGWEHIFCTRAIVQHHTVSLKEVNYVFPLNVVAEGYSLALGRGMSPNFCREFLKIFSALLNLSVDQDTRLPQGLGPEDIFHYIYAVLHSPGYRSRYAEFLKIDFPRIPFPGSLELFRELARLGGELIGLHLMESPKLDDFITTFTGPKNSEIVRVGWSDNTVWLDAAATKKGQSAKPGAIGFHGVPETVWNFHIGGYQVCEKWLKDRKGRTLTEDDIHHYQKIVVALQDTIRLMHEIDAVIERYGGWPGAFTAEK